MTIKVDFRPLSIFRLFLFTRNRFRVKINVTHFGRYPVVINENSPNYNARITRECPQWLHYSYCRKSTDADDSITVIAS